MKRAVIAIALLPAVCAVAGAQQEYSQQVLKQLALTPEQVEKLADIQDQGQAEVAAAQADAAVARAELTRLLVSADPDMGAVEKAVRAASAADVRIKMSQIRRELAVRKAIGDRKWRQLVALSRAAATTKATGAAGAGSATGAGGDAAGTAREQRVRALLRELLDLMGQPRPSAP